MHGAWLFYLIITIIVVGGYISFLRGAPALVGLRNLVPLTLLVATYILLLWLSPLVIIKQRGVLLYFLVQWILAFMIGWLTVDSWFAVMLYMSLTGLGIAMLWQQPRLVAIMGVLGLALSAFHMVRSWGWAAVGRTIPTLLIIFAFVVIYVALFTRQTQSLARVQSLLRELEITHEQLRDYADQVEVLTLNQERQRMSRELHDTLVQGVAGLILQLEAIDSHLDRDDQDKAQQTVRQAMDLARTTLAEARRAVQALRPALLDSNDLADALEQEVVAFEVQTGMPVSFSVEGDSSSIPPSTAQEILRIAQECLVNVHKHARAEHVSVVLDAGEGILRLEVQDDGVGFDVDRVGDLPTAFGLRGMRERAERLGGVLQVNSAEGEGTRICLKVKVTGD